MDGHNGKLAQAAVATSREASLLTVLRSIRLFS